MAAQLPDPSLARPDVTGQRFTTPVDFTEGMLGRTQTGELGYDGAGRVTLTAEGGRIVFSASTAELGKVRRAETALYFKVNGKTYCALFGDYKKYMLQSAVLGQGGVVGGHLSQKRGREVSEASGLEHWVELFKQSSVMGLNASPQGIWKNFFVRPAKWILMVTAIIVVLMLLTRR